MKPKCKFTIAIFAILFASFLATTTTAAAAAANVAATTNQTANANTTTTTQAPKINILQNALCKKCICDEADKQIDCSQKLGAWFTADEWQTLQNGDLIFETIKLEHNNLTEINALPDYGVKKLFLGFNQIDKIAKGAFANLTLLETLDLSHNKLNTKMMVPDVFKGQYSANDFLPLANMKELYLGYNDMHSLDADLFEHLPKLETLSLCENPFQTINQLTETAISGLTSLKTLDMSYMELKKLPDDFLHGPRDLQTLILTGNLMQQLPKDLDRAVNLKELVLDENLFVEMSAENNTMPLLKNLEYLSISDMPDLRIIDKGALSQLPKLKTLVLANNPNLRTIHAAAFSKKTANPLILDYPPIEKLYLHNNNLTELPYELLRRWDQVEVLDLRYNPWICDCRNNYLIKTLTVQINATTEMLLNDVICNAPQQFRTQRLFDVAKSSLFVCDRAPWHSDVLMLFLALLVGIVVGVPVTIGTLVLYRRGCFGLRNRNHGTALYNRASFADDFHI